MPSSSVLTVAVRCIGETSRLIAEAAERAGARRFISCMKVSTMEGTQELMNTPLTALILATVERVGESSVQRRKPHLCGPGKSRPTLRNGDVPKGRTGHPDRKVFDNGTCARRASDHL